MKSYWYKKFIFVFIFFITIPFAVIVSFFIVKSNRLFLQNDHTVNEKLAAQTIASIRQPVRLAENMCKQILQNDMMIDFLNKQYREGIDLAYYMNTIKDFVKITNGVSDAKVKIYIENQTIPMGFGIFYPFSHIEQYESIQGFYADNIAARWFDGDVLSQWEGYEYRLEWSQAFCYMHKIKFGETKLGILIVSVPKAMFSNIQPDSAHTMIPIEDENYFVYNFTGSALPKKQISDLKKTGSSFIQTRNTLCSFYNFSDMPFSIMVITARSRFSTVASIGIFIGILLALVLTALFIQFNRKTMQDINQCLDGMDEAITNSFQTEIIVKRHDEISDLAQRINFLLQKIRALLVQEVSQQTLAKETQLIALQQQINPHFMYNTMELFSARMERNGLYEESSAIAAFCRMLRYTVNNNELTASISEELKQVEYYLAIQRMRSISFNFTADIPRELSSCQVIKFLLQPFVENSFKYRKEGLPLSVTVSAHKEQDGIQIVISDNGSGISKAKQREMNTVFKESPIRVQTSGKKIGLSNINSRLKLFYGEEHAIHVFEQNGLTCFSFMLPLKQLRKHSDELLPLMQRLAENPSRD